MIDLKGLSDDALTEHLAGVVANERLSEADVIATLVEFRRRKLDLKKGKQSLFHYCRDVLHYSENDAYKRMQAAKVASRYGSIIKRLETGELSLSTVCVLAPHLTPENHRSLLDRARCKSKREVETLVAALAPRPDVREVIRRLPLRESLLLTETEMSASEMQPASSTSTATSPIVEPLAAPEKIEPLAADRIRFAFTGDQLFQAKVDRCRQLLRHKHPHGRLQDIFEETVEAFLNLKDPDRRVHIASAGRKRFSLSRRVPQWVKDAVWKRDEGCCTFTTKEGARCSSKDFLEFDHIVPWALGGTSNHPGNIRLLCRAHNQLEAEQLFGPLPQKATPSPEAGEERPAS